MKKYTSSTINETPITDVKLSLTTKKDLDSLKDMLDKGLLEGDIKYNGLVEVSNQNETELFDYSFSWYEIDNITEDLWHDAFLCDVQNDNRICVLK